MYSRSQSFDGVPPLVSRRVLETLTYLARNHPYVANILLQFKLPTPFSLDSEKARGKAVMINEDDNVERPSHQLGSYAIALLLSLLNQPLYLGSIAHLEQLLNLLDVIIDNAHKKSSLSVESGVYASKQVLQIFTSGADINTGAAGLTSGSDIVPASSSKVDNSLKPSTSSIAESDTEEILISDMLVVLDIFLIVNIVVFLYIDSPLVICILLDNAYSTAAEFLKKFESERMQELMAQCGGGGAVRTYFV
ncbi:uncharacterized protein LOC124943403 [Impatiens glandulifera]|uniref:uncharacterized protein LOC124943403 n=1 Tax=Impatiens glandulifera TaxID=253017 RepID=UPI001FB0B95D|nr:uncharacterized protein LOC124943403 [Impatiens glandulifera]